MREDGRRGGRGLPALVDFHTTRTRDGGTTSSWAYVHGSAGAGAGAGSGLGPRARRCLERVGSSRTCWLVPHGRSRPSQRRSEDEGQRSPPRVVASGTRKFGIVEEPSGCRGDGLYERGVLPPARRRGPLLLLGVNKYLKKSIWSSLLHFCDARSPWPPELSRGPRAWLLCLTALSLLIG